MATLYPPFITALPLTASCLCISVKQLKKITKKSWSAAPETTTHQPRTDQIMPRCQMIVGWERSRESEVRLPFFFFTLLPHVEYIYKNKIPKLEKRSHFQFDFFPSAPHAPPWKERERKKQRGRGGLLQFIYYYLDMDQP